MRRNWSVMDERWWFIYFFFGVIKQRKQRKQSYDGRNNYDERKKRHDVNAAKKRKIELRQSKKRCHRKNFIANKAIL